MAAGRGLGGGVGGVRGGAGGVRLAAERPTSGPAPSRARRSQPAAAADDSSITFWSKICLKMARILVFGTPQLQWPGDHTNGNNYPISAHAGECAMVIGLRHHDA